MVISEYYIFSINQITIYRETMQVYVITINIYITINIIFYVITINIYEIQENYNINNHSK